MKTKFLLFFLASFGMLYAQNTFQKVIKNHSPAFSPFIKLSPDGKNAYVLMSDTTATLSKIDESGTISWSKRVINSSSSFINEYFPTNDGGVILLFNVFKGVDFQYAQIVRLDEQGNFVWSKKIAVADVHVSQIVEDDEGNFWVSTNKIDPTNFELQYAFILKMDKNGNFLQSKRVQLGKKRTFVWHILFDKKTNSILFDVFEDGVSSNITYGYLFSINKQMTLNWSKALQPDLSLLFWNKTESSLIFTGFVNRQPLPSSIVVGKINIADGNLIALKTSLATHFPLVSTNQNTIMIGYAQRKVFGKYDENFNPIWTKKHADCSNELSINAEIRPDGASFFVKNIQNYNGFIFGRADAQGNIANCPMKDTTPVLLKDTLFSASQTFKDFTYETSKINLISANTLFAPIDLSAEDYCPQPNATFSIPAQICENAVFQPQNILFPTAKHLWIFGALSNDFSPMLSFDKSGKGKIFHLVTVNGCSDTLSQYIHVLKAPILPKDTQTCTEKNIVLDFKNSFADTFLVNQKKIKPPLIISQSGIYNLILKNKVCKSEGNIKVDFVLPPVIDFQVDSVYCEDEPYLAQIFDYEKVIWDKNINSSTLLIRDIKEHRYEAIFKGCLVKGTLQIPRKECPLPEILFVPTIFSPNEDGINDVFKAFGNDFKLLKMEIFDRWGNHVFSSDHPEAAWDGMYRKQAAAEAVYTYYIDYQDLKRDIVRKKKGDVTLIR